MNLGGGTSFVQTSAIINNHEVNPSAAGNVNFHGGKLVATVDADGVGTNPTFIQGNTDIAHVYIYAEGAKIDTNGHNALIAHDLEAPKTGGVYGTGSSNVISVTTPGSGYISVPFVLVQDADGTGTGATAIAVMSTTDPTVVDHIQITNPGVGYTTPTFKFSGGTSLGGVDATCTETVTPSANVSGGLTKLGTGTLILTGALTYAGNTDIQAGTLSIDNGLKNSLSTISGHGSLAVGVTNASTRLTVASIRVGTLSIGSAGSLANAVPEPGMFALLGIALLALVGRSMQKWRA